MENGRTCFEEVQGNGRGKKTLFGHAFVRVTSGLKLTVSLKLTDTFKDGGGAVTPPFFKVVIEAPAVPLGAR